MEDKVELLNKRFDDFLRKYNELRSELKFKKIAVTFFVIELSNWKKCTLYITVR